MSDTSALENLKYAHAIDVSLDLTSQEVHELWADIEARDKRVAELESAQRWAPLEDPPKFDGRYLLRNIYGDVYSSKYVVKTETWVVHDFAMFTHWMPLPESPNDTQTDTFVYGKDSER